jgi:hypothetical protein
MKYQSSRTLSSSSPSSSSCFSFLLATLYLILSVLTLSSVSASSELVESSSENNAQPKMVLLFKSCLEPALSFTMLLSLASLQPARLLLLAADARRPFLPPFLPAAAFLALVLNLLLSVLTVFSVSSSGDIV